MQTVRELVLAAGLSAAALLAVAVVAGCMMHRTLARADRAAERSVAREAEAWLRQVSR